MVRIKVLKSYLLFWILDFGLQPSRRPAALMGSFWIFIVIWLASTSSTIPSSSAITSWPESLATLSSIPVQTKGTSGFIKGAACLCIFDPIKARFASSFCKKGIREVATEIDCSGETSIKSILSLSISPGLPFILASTFSRTSSPFSLIGTPA